MNLQEELIRHRRTLHAHPELGFDLPFTSQYVFDELTALGLCPQWLGPCGIVATIGTQQAPCILLRADMDALPLHEQSGEPFAATNGNMHACGHDFHMSMLLGAAALLKAKEDELEGCVKLMFQPNEESVEGAMAMIEAGVLEGPKVDCAMALHVEVGNDPVGTLCYQAQATTAASDIFEIRIQGKSAHGAMPYQGVDPINIAAHIYLGLMELVSRELNAFHPSVLTIGQLSAGEAHNIIPESAVLKGTLRTFHERDRAFLLRRIQEISQGIAMAFQGQAQLHILHSVDSIYNDPALIQSLQTVHEEGPYALQKRQHPWIVSEDFCWIANRVPSAFLTLSVGNAMGGQHYPLHNAKATFDEQALLIGATFMADSASALLAQYRQNEQTKSTQA
ncbi:MAG: M20 metallopeptidase family protein [Erysipelotrichaceae bacterium]